MASRYTKEQYEQAQSQNIGDYLQAKGHPFTQNGYYLKSKQHSSLVIDTRNGSWHWNAKDLHGNKPVELLKQLLIYEQNYSEKEAFIEAIQELGGTARSYVPQVNYSDRAMEEPKGELVVPPKNNSNSRAIAYLVTSRGIDYDLVRSQIAKGRIYQTKDFGNVAFVSTDKENTPKHIHLKGTYTNAEKSFKKDVENSDKAYGFTLTGRPEVKWVVVFESSIDVLSHATLTQMKGNDISDKHRLALHGTSFKALEKFLEEHPSVKGIIPALDNDATGQLRNIKMKEHFEPLGYVVHTPSVPSVVKDFNDMLMSIRGKEKQIEQQETYQPAKEMSNDDMWNQDTYGYDPSQDYQNDYYGGHEM